MKILGQHFLTNKIKLQKIAKILDLKADDTIIEIGPGHGELTSFLAKDFLFLDSKFQLILIEKDEEFVRLLRKKFKLDKNIEIVQGDALRIIPELTKNYKFLPAGRQEKIENYKVVGNIPYYITGRLLRIISELENKPVSVVLTVQKEVAERICAEPSQMNLLAASVQIWAEPKIIDYIPKTDFQPQPKVDSAIIELVIKKLNNYEIAQLPNYYKLIKILFKQPRKTILNNLREAHQTKEEIIKILEELKINPNDRPQNLTIEQIKTLSGRLRY